MADVTYTYNAIKDDVSRKGVCDVPFATVEHLLSASSDDDDQDFLDAVDAWVAECDWLSAHQIDWINRRVCFHGPYTEPGTDL